MQVGVGPIRRRLFELAAEGAAVIGLQDDESAGIKPHDLLKQRLCLCIHALQLLLSVLEIELMVAGKFERLWSRTENRSDGRRDKAARLLKYYSSK